MVGSNIHLTQRKSDLLLGLWPGPASTLGPHIHLISFLSSLRMCTFIGQLLFCDKNIIQRLLNRNSSRRYPSTVNRNWCARRTPKRGFTHGFNGSRFPPLVCPVHSGSRADSQLYIWVSRSVDSRFRYYQSLHTYLFEKCFRLDAYHCRSSIRVQRCSAPSLQVL